jgi:hypothetical protein
MAVDFPKLLADLNVETTNLHEILSGLRADQWELPTLADGSAIRDQVSHLAYFDEAAGLALTDTAAFDKTAKSYFILNVTQRRHWTDTALAAEGLDARQWTAIAQAYAGARGKGRDPQAAVS